MMIYRRMFPLLLMPAMLGVACSESPTEPGQDTGLAPFVGTWVATGFDLANLVNLSQLVDVMARGGSFTLIVTSDGRFTTDEFVPPEPRDMESGTLRITGGNTLVLVFDEPDPINQQNITISVVFQFSDSGRRLTLVSDEAEFDFDGDGADEAARATLALVKS